MRKFIYKLLIAVMPFCIMLGPFILVAWYTGEISDFDTNIERQRNSEQEILLGLGYNEQTEYYKVQNIEYYKPKIIALGTSRVMQYKGVYFNEGEFYNAGGSINRNIGEYLNFLMNIEDSKPDMIILGLDAWFFNDNWNSGYEDIRPFVKLGKSTVNIQNTIIDISKDYFEGKWTFGDVFEGDKNIGFNGILKGNGYMKDGSYYYGDNYRNPEEQTDYNFQDTYTRILNGNKRFEYGSEVSEKALKELEELLGYCKSENIDVIGVLNPFAPSVYKAMEQNGNYTYIDKIYDECEPMFSAYQYELYDLQDGSIFDCEDDSFVDGFHGSEVAYGRIVKYIIDQDSKIKQYVNERKLNELLDKAYSEYIFCEP